MRLENTWSPLATPDELARQRSNGPMPMMRTNILNLMGIVAVAALPAASAKAEIPAAVALPGARVIASVHAQGAQIYECKADAAGNLAWQFREPVATLISDGKTVGRHFAGPSWELVDGSMLVAKPQGGAPGASATDIPLLKLSVTSQSGAGQLTGITSIQRINTQGGALAGTCANNGALTSVPYAADYVFLQDAN